MWWIKSAIQEYILRSWSLVRMGTTANHRKLFFNLRKAKSRISALEEGDMLPQLAIDVVRRGVAVLVATGGEPSALAAKTVSVCRSLRCRETAFRQQRKTRAKPPTGSDNRLQRQPLSRNPATSRSFTISSGNLQLLPSEVPEVSRFATSALSPPTPKLIARSRDNAPSQIL